MKVFVFLSLVFGAGVVLAKTDCSNSLFEGGPSYSCKTAKGAEVCVATGHHTAVKRDGVYLFTPGDESGAFNHMIFENPAPAQCKLAAFKACTHQTFENDGTSLVGYRYRAPDVWDARSSQWFLNIDLATGTGKFEIKAYDVDGELRNHLVHDLKDCK